MIRKISIVFLCVAMIFTFPKRTSAISAESYVLIDSVTQEIVSEYNSSKKMSMASTTKLMTALICDDYINSNSDELFLISDDMIRVEGSSMGLRAGDKLKISDLLVGLLLSSGNDAANSLAIHIAGSCEIFADMMNHKASQIGMQNTHFVTPSGLDEVEHYSTAYDMSILMSYCLKSELISNIMNLTSKEIEYFSSIKNSKIKVTLNNHNKLLEMYEFCDSGKTGYTKKSGRCLVSSACKNDLRFIAVSLNAPDDWNDHISLYESAFSKTKTTTFAKLSIKIPFANTGFHLLEIPEKNISSLINDNIERKIFLPRFIYEKSYNTSETVGKVCYYKNNILFKEYEIKY